ncbi:MAG TPA: hypothetical protein VGF77_05565 [Allosphingosinicella sp.]|jgi:hypothetical protein
MTERTGIDRDAVAALVAHRARVREWWESRPTRDATRRASDNAAPHPEEKTPEDRALRQSLVGLALSGGGIRSATFSLGLIQALARRPARGWARNALGRIDILSTVSGGGYIGCFLRSLFVPGAARGIAPQVRIEDEGGADTIVLPPDWPQSIETQYEFAHEALASRACERRLDWPRSDGGRGVRNPIWWLREHSRYLAPNGLGDYGYAVAYLARNWIAMLYVFALAAALILAVPILAEGWLARLWHVPFGWTWVPLPSAPPPPCTLCAAAHPLPPPLHFVPVSPIAALAILPLLASIVFGIAYWMTEAMSPNEKAWPRLWLNLGAAVAAMLAGLVLILLADEWIGRFPHRPSWPPMLAWPLLDRAGHWHFGFPSLVAAGLAAAAAACFLALLVAGWTQIGEGRSALLTAETRRRLTALAVSNLWLLRILVVALIDSSAVALDSWFATTSRFSALAAALVPLLAFLINKLPGWFEGKGKGKAGALLRTLLQPLAFAAGFILYGAVAIMVGAVLHHVAWSGPGWQSQIQWRLFLLLAAAIAVLALIAGGSTGFINLSSLHGLYAARLTRAYLGASNMGRLEKVAAAHRGSGITENDPGDYIRPELYSRLDLPAPLHLINTTLNETVDPRSQLVERDRKGEMLTLTPKGVEIGIDRAVGWTALGKRDCAEHLSLGQWCAISGAAVSSGMGRLTHLGYALALSFANVRLGYWWWSPGVDPDFRRRQWQRPFETFLYLRDEMIAHYSRRRSRKYLTDGGHFENTGAYRLLKRRVPLILVSDNAADPDHVFANLETLVRTTRIDLGGEIRILGGTARKAQLRAWGCHPKDHILFVDPDADRDWRKAFARPSEPASYLVLEAAFDDATIHLLWIKPRLLADVPPDILGYATANKDFPQQPTIDQSFDEAQWESYRRLGGLSMDRLLDALPKLFP